MSAETFTQLRLLQKRARDLRQEVRVIVLFSVLPTYMSNESILSSFRVD